MMIVYELLYTCEVFIGLMRQKINKQKRTATSPEATSWFWAKQKQKFWIWLYALKNGTADLLDIIQIVPFTILPSTAIMLVILGIKWLTHKMSCPQEEICRDKWGRRCQKCMSHNSYFGRKIWTDRSENIWYLGQRGGNCSSWDTAEWRLGWKPVSSLIPDSSNS